MNRVSARGVVAILFAIFFATEVQAESIVFDSNYPKANAAPGQIDVKGTITLDSCSWSIPSKMITIEVWQAGGEVRHFTGTVTGSGTSYSFTGFASGLDLGVEYRVFVEVVVDDGCQSFSMLTDVVGVTTNK